MKNEPSEYEKPAYSYPIMLVIAILLFIFSNVEHSEIVTENDSKPAKQNVSKSDTANGSLDTTSVYYVKTGVE